MNRTFFPYLLIASGAGLWGMIGIFILQLDQYGFSSLQIVALRVISASIILFTFMFFRCPKKLSIRFSDFHLFIGTGLLSITFFNWCYFTAIKETGLTVAVILLYTGPAFVVIMASIFFKESLNRQKVFGLFATFIGAALVVQFVPFQGFNLSLFGVLAGIGSGFGYALYSIFGKFALKKYSPITITFYTFLVASIFLIPFSGILSKSIFINLAKPPVIWNILGLGLFPTVLAYILYTEGLSRIETGKAAITTMTEPVAATLIGVFAFGDILNIYQIIGIVIVLFSVIFIQVQKPKLIKSTKL